MPKEDSADSSAELVFRTQLSLPGEWLADSEQPASSFLQELCRRPLGAIPTRPISYAEAVMTPPAHLADVEMVLVRKGPVSPPLAPQYDSPYRVMAIGPKVFHLDFGGWIEVVSVDRLKPFLGESTEPALTPRRGRPLGLPAASTPAASRLGGGMCRGHESEKWDRKSGKLLYIDIIQFIDL